MNPAESPLQRVKSGHLRFALAKAPVEENLPKSKDSKRIAWFFRSFWKLLASETAWQFI
jgi:hypothetical protein